MRHDHDTGKPLVAFGLNLNADGSPIRGAVNTRKVGDHGCDPIGDGTYRMVPSGDIVNFEERCKRLAAWRAS
jgi:hypothetical protein